MTTLDSIIEINITRETTAVERAAFNIPMFLADHTAFTERAREYTSLSAVANDFRATTNVYKAASQFFGQEVKPPRCVIGRRQVDEVTVSVGTVANSTQYSITVNGVTVNFTSDSSATAQEIVDGLEAAFSTSGVTGITFTDNSNGTFDIGPTAPGTAWSLKVSTNLNTSNTTPTETWVDALEAVQSENNTWFALCLESHVQADILAIAAAIEAKKKMYFTSSSDVTIKSNSTSDLGTTLRDLAYDNTSLIYSADAANYPECAWVGGQLPYTPGSTTWMFKTLVGILPDNLSDTEVTNLKNKNVNKYQRVGGVNITSDGVVASGEFIDVMVGTYWLEARMQERIYSRLVNSLKIPYTQAGLTIIENEMRAVLAEGINNDFLAANPAPTVSMPNVLTVEQNLKAMRTVEGITFTATLAGAVHYVKIQGTLSL